MVKAKQCPRNKVKRRANCGKQRADLHLTHIFMYICTVFITRKRERLVPSFYLSAISIIVSSLNLEKLIAQKLEEEEFKDCYLVEIKGPTIANKLEIFIDSDSSMTFKKCQQISRFLESHIDEKKWLGEKYTLEVSSPGVGNPLKFKRQYIKNVGRKMEIQQVEGNKVEGTLVAVEDDAISIEGKVREKVGKKKVTKEIITKIEFDNIKTAKVKVSFK